MNKKNQMIIFFVANQEASKKFYQQIFDANPILDVPGMTEFEIPGSDVLLGLMPENGIVKILGDKTPHPSSGNGVPRCELYLFVEEPDEKFEMALKGSAKEISRMQLRSWGDYVAYISDPDGNVIAFAKAE